MDGITPVENDVASVMHMVKAIDVRDLIAVCDALTMCGSVSSNFVSADFRKMRTDSFQKSRTTRFRKIRVVR